MSVRSEKSVHAIGTDTLATIEAAQSADTTLAEGNSFCTATPENPLKRNIVVSIKASLNDFCLQKSRGTWAPSQEALRSIFQVPRPATSPCAHVLTVFSFRSAAKEVHLARRLRGAARRPQIGGPSRHDRQPRQVDLPDVYAPYPCPDTFPALRTICAHTIVPCHAQPSAHASPASTTTTTRSPARRLVR